MEIVDYLEKVVLVGGLEGHDWFDDADLTAWDEDTIALQAELEAHRWIPVEERLPEHNGVGVFVCDANDEGMPKCWGCSYDSGKFRRDGVDMTDRITHWKPIILP